MVLLICIYATSFKWDLARIKPKKGKKTTFKGWEEEMVRLQ
jgi:hypothetical protein